MKKQINVFMGVIFLVAVGLAIGAQAQDTPEQNLVAVAVGTAFSYQGVLTDGGQPANGAYDLEFALFDAASGGNQIGATLTVGNQEVNNGLLLVQLDFGQNVFTGSPRYLEIRVRPGSSSGGYETLSDRQPLQASPYAIHAGSATALTDADGNAVVQVGNGGNVGVGLNDPAANVHILGNLSHPLTGTVTVGANSVNVVGVGTLFTQELVAGDALLIGTERFTVQTIVSDIDLTLDRPHPTGALNEVAYADSDLFVVQNGDGVTTLAMDKSGNLGIGTTDPISKFDVNGTARVGYLNIVPHYPPSGNGEGGELQLAGVDGFSDINLDNSDGIARFFQNGVVMAYFAHAQSYMSGNLGIGTMNPTAKLDVAGNLDFDGQKACRVADTGVYLDTILVPSGWTASTCVLYLSTLTGGDYYYLFCIFHDGFSVGSVNGGIPNPNCGW